MQKKNRIELAITVILIFILLFFVINAIKKARPQAIKKSESTVIEEQKQPPSQEKIPVTKDLYGALEEKSKSLELKRVPFSLAPITPLDKYSSGIYLNGILWDKTSPMAIINDQVVKRGDTVSGKIVVDIKQDGVILNDGTKDFQLRLEGKN